MKVHQYDDHGIGVEARCKDCNKKFGNLESMKDTYKPVICPRTKNALSARRLANHQKDCQITWM